MPSKDHQVQSPQTGEPGAISGLELSPDTLRRLQETAGISIWMWRPEQNRVHHAITVSGTEPIAQGLPLEAVLERIRPADRTRVKRRLRAVARRRSVSSFQFGIDIPGRASRVYSATAFPGDDARPSQLVQIIVQDVTRARQTDQALRESIDHYRTAVELNPEIPWLAAPDGTIIEVGPRWLDSVGLSQSEALGRGWLSALHPDDVPGTVELWSRCLETGEPVDVEYRVRVKSGDYRWMRARAAARRDAEGRIVRWYGTLEDIHDRRQVEAALRDSEEFARSILEASAVAIEVLDDAGRLIFINGPGVRIMEVDDPAAVVGRPFASFWPEDVAPVVQGAIQLALRGDATRQTLFGPTAKGSPRWWDLSLSPILDGEGRVRRVLALSRDVTEAKRNEVEVGASARRLANVLESTMDSVISVDAEWHVTYMNRRAMSVFPQSSAPFIGRDIRDLFDPVEAEPFFVRYRQAMAEQRSIAFEDYLPSAGAWFEVQAYGSSAGLIIFFRDVTERRLAQEQIAHLARHDALTGLPNRVQFHERLVSALQELRAGGHLAVFSLDLDDFKLINDTMGHRAGDVLLTQVADRLRRAVGDNCLAARLGGDEFAVLLRVDRPEQAGSAAQQLLDAVAAPYDLEGEEVAIGASIGIAIAPRDGRGSDAILHCADLALYRVKADKGRDYRFFEPEMDRQLRERREMKRDLALALSRHELHLVYQPQIEIGSNRLTGFEALLRWDSPSRGPVAPSVFIPLAEESGLIEDIGAYVLEQACREAARWPGELSVAVNLSPAQFRSKAVRGAVNTALERSGLAPARLELEITESVLLDDSTGAIDELRALHQAGVRVALDDFGTGYSSLSYLRRFPFDKIKIDRSFVADLPQAADSVAIVRAIIGLGRSIGSRVTAEGVETFEQLMFLATEGCNEAQGYLFSQPLPARQARALAQTRGGLVAQPMQSSRQRTIG